MNLWSTAIVDKPKIADNKIGYLGTTGKTCRLWNSTGGRNSIENGTKYLFIKIQSIGSDRLILTIGMHFQRDGSGTAHKRIMLLAVPFSTHKMLHFVYCFRSKEHFWWRIYAEHKPLGCTLLHQFYVGIYISSVDAFRAIPDRTDNEKLLYEKDTLPTAIIQVFIYYFISFVCRIILSVPSQDICILNYKLPSVSFDCSFFKVIDLFHA